MAWVNAPAVAEHLGGGISVKTVLMLARTKSIPGTKVGRSWRFDLDDIDAHLKRPVDPWKQSNQSRGRKRAV